MCPECTSDDNDAATWHLAPEGSAACDSGSVASQSDCEAAVKWLAAAAGQTPARTLQVGGGGACLDGSWGQVPAGCSAQTGGDWAAHYKSTATGAGCVLWKLYQLVCSGGAVNANGTGSEATWPSRPGNCRADPRNP